MKNLSWECITYSVLLRLQKRWTSSSVCNLCWKRRTLGQTLLKKMFLQQTFCSSFIHGYFFWSGCTRVLNQKCDHSHGQQIFLKCTKLCWGSQLYSWKGTHQYCKIWPSIKFLAYKHICLSVNVLMVWLDVFQIVWLFSGLFFLSPTCTAFFVWCVCQCHCVCMCMCV